MFTLLVRSWWAEPSKTARVVGCTLRRHARGYKLFRPKSLAFAFCTCCILFQLSGVSDGTNEKQAGNPKRTFNSLGCWGMFELSGTRDAMLSGWILLERWNLKQSDLLPSGGNVPARAPSFWVRTKWLWMSAFLMILTLNVIALYVRLRKVRERHIGLSGQLITAQEKERRRLASEIHDDFSQRMALLAIGLENAEEAVATSPDEAARQMHILLNSASEIGADLHTLSHRLHSSTLERLGLVPGVSALCQEFASRHSVEVDFLSEDIPDFVPPDVALCIFRIVQEGLRNFQKHSGASKAEVRLRGATDRVFVSIRDKGIGFDTREMAKKEGLGIRSMEERAYLLGGRFKIHSEPGRGTEIIAWVPVEPRLNQEAG